MSDVKDENSKCRLPYPHDFSDESCKKCNADLFLSGDEISGGENDPSILFYICAIVVELLFFIVVLLLYVR